MEENPEQLIDRTKPISSLPQWNGTLPPVTTKEIAELGALIRSARALVEITQRDVKMARKTTNDVTCLVSNNYPITP